MNSPAIHYAKSEDEFEYRAETFLKACSDVLTMYMPGADRTIEILVGRTSKATVKFSGPITQEVLMDTIAHLHFYKKYFPKDETGTECDMVERFAKIYRAILAEDREAREISGPKSNDERT